MLEEYLCLGGNEVINNARTYGYATTSGCPVTWFRCEPCDSLHDVLNDWIPPTYSTIEVGRNLGTYPDLVLNTTGPVRTNLVLDPSARNVNDTFWPQGGVTLSQIDGTPFGTQFAARGVATTANIRFTARTALPINTQYTVRLHYRLSADAGSATTISYSPQGPTTTGRVVIVPASGLILDGQPHEVVATFTTGSVASNATGGIGFLSNSSATVGSTFEIAGDVIVEQGPTVGPFFDGGTPTPLRTNLVNNPKLGTNQTGWTVTSSGQNRKPIQGTPPPEMTFAVGSYDGTPNGGNTRIMANLNNLIVGATYTVSAWLLRTGGPSQAGISPDTQAGNYTVILAPSGTNASGGWERFGGTFVATATTMYFKAQHSATTGDPITLLMTGTVLESGVRPGVTTYFDGSTAMDPTTGLRGLWTGTADASQSWLIDGRYPYQWTGAPNSSPSTFTAMDVHGVSVAAPSLEAIVPEGVRVYAGNTAWVTQRTNLSTNPALSVADAGWAPASISAVMARTAVADLPGFSWAYGTASANVAMPANGRIYTSDFPLTIGDTYTFSAWVKVTTENARFYIRGAGSGGAGTILATVSLTSNGGAWQRVSATIVATEAVAHPTLWLASGAGAGTTFLMTGVLVERAGSMLDYFDGDTPDPDFDERYEWTGPAGLSTSILQTSAVTSPAIGLAGTGLPSAGQVSMIVRMRANRERTVQMRIGAGSEQTITVTKDWADYRVFVTATDASQAGLVLTDSVAGDWLDIDRYLYGAGDYDGEWFDGDSVEPTPNDNIYWTGAVNASPSIWERTQVNTPGHSTEPPYTTQNISHAPWYDADFEPSSRFYGVFAITMENMNSSTRTATVTEGILDGGVVGLVRHATRQMRVRALLVAQGEDALEYGLAWLSAVLETDTCSSHGNACGAVDLNFFAACPTTPDPSMTETISTPESRHMHNVTVISGPLVEQKIQSSNKMHIGYIVEFTMVAGTPWVFSETRPINITPQQPIVVQDVPYNLSPYPSAELSSGTVVIATNYSTNPSVEVNATGWTTISGGGLSGTVTGTRSTDISSVGVASFRANWTAGSAGSAGWLGGQQIVTIPMTPAGIRFSVSMWAFASIASGTAVLGDIAIEVVWRAGSTELRTDTVGTVPASGGAPSLISALPPATADTAVVRSRATVTSWSSGAVINVYTDALTVSVP